MRKVMAFLLVVLFGAVTVFSAGKVVLNQSVVIHYSPAHYDTTWIDGVKTAVYVPAGRDTTVPATGYRRYYAIVDTALGADTSNKFWIEVYRKKGASVITYDTVKFNGLQPGSWIILDATCTK
jgi:hypothetical protein